MSKKLVVAINVVGIQDIFVEYCEKNKIEFSKEKFEVFLKFLEIDFYDWVRENLSQFYKQK